MSIKLNRDLLEKMYESKLAPQESSPKKLVLGRECWPIEPSIAVSESVSHCIFGTNGCPEGFHPEDSDWCDFITDDGRILPQKTQYPEGGRNVTSKILQCWRESLVLGYILEPEKDEFKFEPLTEDRGRYYKQKLALCPLVCSRGRG